MKEFSCEIHADPFKQDLVLSVGTSKESFLKWYKKSFFTDKELLETFEEAFDSQDNPNGFCAFTKGKPTLIWLNGL